MRRCFLEQASRRPDPVIPLLCFASSRPHLPPSPFLLNPAAFELFASRPQPTTQGGAAPQAFACPAPARVESAARRGQPQPGQAPRQQCRRCPPVRPRSASPVRGAFASDHDVRRLSTAAARSWSERWPAAAGGAGREGDRCARTGATPIRPSATATPRADASAASSSIGRDPSVVRSDGHKTRPGRIVAGWAQASAAASVPHPGGGKQRHPSLSCQGIRG
jgi:hypothetical protein